MLINLDPQLLLKLPNNQHQSLLPQRLVLYVAHQLPNFLSQLLRSGPGLVRINLRRKSRQRESDHRHYVFA